MTLSITAYGTTPGEISVSVGHHTTPDGAPVSAAARLNILRAVTQALTDQLELLTGCADSAP